MTYTKEMRKKAVEDFWKQKNEYKLLSIRTHVALIVVLHCTFRD